MTEQHWFVYMLRCSDNSFYFGATTSVSRRYKEHSSGGSKCAKYLRGRRPLQLIGYWKFDSKSEALKTEIRFKKLSRPKKEDLALKVSKGK